MNLIAKDRHVAVIGLGKTGLSCVRHLVNKGIQVTLFDSNPTPRLAPEVIAEFPGIPCIFGSIELETLLAVDEIVISPGVPLATPEIKKAVDTGIPVIGDIDLFLRDYQGQVIAITGSNGKSTVTELVGEMAKDQKINAEIGGNIGIPVLDLLEKELDWVVLELSSFQLETIHEMKGHICTVLNISEDHMDRYRDMPHYLNTKHLIFKHASKVIVHQDDVLTHPVGSSQYQVIPYSAKQTLVNNFYAKENEFGLLSIYLNQDVLLTESELKIKGRHNLLNVMAAMSLGKAAGFDQELMLKTIRAFPGLAHRCQWIANIDGVDFINDSKATNVGAAIAALDGLKSEVQPNIHLIAGGISKDADFTALEAAVLLSCKSVHLIGIAANELFELFDGKLPCAIAESLEQAVIHAKAAASEGDIVLLAPACASFDMFKGFEHRGEQFVSAVEALI